VRLHAHGDGPVRPGDADDPIFEEDWHARALAMTLACGFLGQWNLDMSRHARECLSPKDYSRFSYYEKWMAGLADMLVDNKILTARDLSGEGAADRHDLADRALPAQAVAKALARGGPSERDSNTAPLFAAGQAVRTLRPASNRLVDGGHTRLPAYAAGARGRILRCHGAHVLPDSNAHKLGEAPEPLYAVVFLASELWSAPEHPDDEVILDLWQSYLDPA